MALHQFAAYAIYPNSAALHDILISLGRKGFGKQNICLLFSATHPIAAEVRDSVTTSCDEASNIATAQLIGWLSEFGAVVIPKFGFFLRSPEFYSAILQDRDSGSAHGRSRTLLSLGFPRTEAEHCDNCVADDGVLLYVSCPESQAHSASELMRTAGAEHVGVLAENLATAAVGAS